MTQTGSIRVSNRIKLQKSYNERGPAAFGSINKLTKAIGISREKATELLQSEDFVKYQGIRRKFPRLNAWYIDEIWCLDLAQMDELLRLNRGSKFSLVTIGVYFSQPASRSIKKKKSRGSKSGFYQKLVEEERAEDPGKITARSRKKMFAERLPISARMWESNIITLIVKQM